MEKHVIRFTGGMNSDDDPSNLPEGEYIVLSNYRVYGTFGKGGDLTPVQGDSEIVNVDLPAGTNKTILTLKDPSELKVYVFIYNSNGDHTIWVSTLIGTPTFQLLASGPYLNFTNSQIICTDADVRDGLLYWCHGNFNSYEISGTDQQFSPPRKINLDKAIAFQNGTAGAYVNMDWQTIEAVKYPYALSPTSVYGTDATRKTNFLRGRLYQFRIQYIYDDNEESRWSPISKVALPIFAETMGGAFSSFTERDNQITVSFNSGHHTVSRIKVSYREGNFGAWYNFYEIDKVLSSIASNITLDVIFVNNEAKTPLAISDQNFDLLPQVAQSQELLHNEELVYAKCLEGYENIVPVVVASYTISDIPSPSVGGLDYSILTYEIVGFFPDFIVQIGFFPNTSTSGHIIPVGSVFNLTTKDALGNDYYSQFVTTVSYSSGISGLDDFINDWVTFLNGLGHVITYSLDSGAHDLELDNTAAGAVIEVMILDIDFPIARNKTWKTGNQKIFGIQYYDEANRDGTVQTSDAMRLYIDNRVEQDKTGLSFANSDYLVSVKLTIDSAFQPPIWAKYYQIVVARNVGINSSQDRSVIKIQYSSEYVGRVKLSLERYYRDTYDGATYHHDIQVGDQVILIKKARGTTSVAPDYVDEVLTFTIYRYEEAGGEDDSEAIYIEAFDWENAVDNNEAFLIEIRRSETNVVGEDSESDIIWEEIGVADTVQNAHTASRTHVGQLLNVTDAVIDIPDGDCYKRLRDMGTGFTLDPAQHKSWYVEDFHYSDYYISNFNNRGRLGISDVNNRQTWNNVIRSSNKFIQDTKVNGLSRFDALSKINLTGDYGTITRVVEVGFTLKVVTRSKEFSIYIDRQEPTDNSGNLVLTDKTFGTVRPMLEDWGTIYPASIFVYERSLYYWDVQEVAFVESNANGQLNLAGNKFKMSSNFKLISDYAVDDGNIETSDFVVGADTEHNVIWFSYRSFDGSLVKGTIVFNLKMRRWEHYIDLFAENMIDVRQTLYSFEAGVMYVQEFGNPLVFRGVQATMSLLTASSFASLPQVKTFVNIDSLSDKHPGQGIVDGNTTGSYSAMKGYFFANLWEQLESEWVNSLSGDRTNVQGIEWLLAQNMDGRDIRGNYFIISFSKAEDFPTISHFVAYYLNSLV